ncbi:cobalt ABC transporter permease [Maliponia aquimaris]|uniref:Nickel uptake substrate-specific transmembrane region n=1 Tax=Maliponia aquimaris TaxID=1673631 RepID=A0A238K1S5_9RHOB|nr:cobalt ABC transporter permease [Maliponia aquimaris]SMX36849.1 hypothetical protein MAA8898_01076 [Maliponia aquimaris]
MKRLALICALTALPVPTLAHNVIAAVFPSGSAIEGEIGFSNGDMAADQPVEVYGPDGALLGTTRTDAEGFFLFTPTQPVAHSFRADMGAGHVADVTLAAEDVARILGTAPAPTPEPAANAPAAPPGSGLTAADRAEIATLLRDELRPLRREIAAYREKNDLQTILGGLGYILGLFGLGFYLAARRQMKG